MSDVSPAVERAISTAEQRAGLQPLRLVHLIQSLLEDDEGRPAVLLQDLGVSLDELRQHLHVVVHASPFAPPVRQLLAATREWSLTHRADPNVLTDAFLLAVLEADSGFQALLVPHGVEVASLRRKLVGEVVASPPQNWHPQSNLVPEEPAEIPPTLTEPSMEAARVIDANLNRARESLRVLDDYCRFVLDDSSLTKQFKTLRHRLAELTSALPARLLLASRDTQADVGTTLTAGREYQRGSVRDVAALNLKRLQESLRSVEEFGKIFGTSFAQGIEQLRYETYTLEAAVLRDGELRARLADAVLYVLLTGSHCKHGLERTIAAAAAGGAGIIQLREKDLDDRQLLELARQVRRWTREAGVLFILNDRPDLARLADADGVHLGQEDLPVREARRILGPEALIGVSTHTIEQVRQAERDGADYIGVGPTFPSTTKSFDHFAGLSFVAAAAVETSRPAFAIGGIGPGNIAEAVAAGATRVAVSAAIAGAEDPEKIAAQLIRALRRNA